MGHGRPPGWDGDAGTPRSVSDPLGRMSRRQMLAALGFGAGAVVVAGCTVNPPPDRPRPTPGAPATGPFPDGVKAGDPAPDGTLIWTRVRPPAGGADVAVLWSVGTDPTLDTVAAGGLALATAADGHSVTVPVTGLQPDRWYWYRFEVDGVAGPVGRLRTAPAPGAPVDHLRFAFCGDQQLNDSWFVAHEAIAAEPGLDFVAHLGDYVYVNDVATLTLDDYRGVYRRWNQRPELRALHAALPFVSTWSDGEFYNGVDRTGPATRLANARKAWFENFPVAGAGPDRQIYRSFAWGALADWFVLDDRTLRDPSVDGVNRIDPPGSAVYDPTRTSLGTEQFAWLTAGLAGSDATWRVVAEDYPIAPWKLLNLEFLRPFRPDLPPDAGLYIPAETWDQYMAQRQDLLDAMAAAGVTDTIFCAAETHISLVSDLRQRLGDGGSPVFAADFTAPSLTADPDVRRAYLPDLPTDVAEGVLNLAERFIIGQNPATMRYMNFVDQGYCVVDVDPERIEVTYRFIDTFDPDARAYDGARFRVTKGGGPMTPLAVERPRGSVGP